MLLNIGSQTVEINDPELERVLMAILPSDVETASYHAINFTEALTLYGSYALPLIARLARIPSNGVTHYYGDKALPDPATNAQNDNVSWSSLTAVDNMGARHSNTCQIMMRAAAVGASAQAEAQVGAVLGISDLIADQRNDAMEAILKDMEYNLLLSVEQTTQPRKMDGVKQRVVDLAGANYMDGSAQAFDEEMLIAWFETIRDRKTGYFPNALYCSGRVLREIASWTESRIQFTIDIRNIGDLTRLAAGKAAGLYVTPDGHMVELLYHPDIGHSATAANNYMMALTESLVKMAFLRGLRIFRTPQLTDGTLDVVLVEFTLQLKVGAAHGLLHNWSLT